MKKDVANVTTEFVKGKGGIVDDALSLVTLGLTKGSTSDHHVATVTYKDGTVSTGEGKSKDSAIKNALK